jgi:uncharacterized damage-inducible protein DinB
MKITDHALTMARYHGWATELLLDALDAVNDADYRQPVGLFFGSIHATLNHLLLVDRVWYGRLVGRPAPYASLREPIVHGRAETRAALAEQCARWVDHVSSLPEERYGEGTRFRTLAGREMELPLGPLVFHVFNHGTHHRGQITAAMSRLGVATPEIDLAYFLPHL